MSTSLQDIEIVGGHPALDFVNTVHNWHADPPPDYLGGFDDLVEWHRLVGLLPAAQAKRFRAAPERARDRAFRAFVAFRNDLRGLLLAVAHGEALPTAALDDLSEILRRTVRWRRLAASARGERLRVEWDFTDAPPEALLGIVAWEAADLLEKGPLERLKECPGERCGWLFLDSSKNRSRTWCSMRTCGNTAKVRRFRSRAGA
jgi:predicted RNA-binding Zn ribbon-like protein